MDLLAVVFWFCLFMMLYPYIIYPLLVIAISRLISRSWSQGNERPRISLIISVYNEEAVIRQKLENALSLDYPEELKEVVVVSDGSTDNTHKIISSIFDRKVILKAYERSGKTACLNRVIDELNGEILVFTDANSMFPQQMLVNIVRNFSDEEIGLVTGWTKYHHSGSVEEAPGIYSRLEMITKDAESKISSCVGADGAIFAIRRELYQPLEIYDINDFVIPLSVVAQNRRVVLDPEVFCYEESTEGAGKEFRRQARITNRTLGALWRGRHFLNPFKYRSFSFLLFSHKLVRFIAPGFFISCFFLSLPLSSVSWIYQFFLVAQIVFIGTGLAGCYGNFENRIIDLSASFLMTICSQLVGWFRFLTGRSDTLWTPQR